MTYPYVSAFRLCNGRSGVGRGQCPQRPYFSSPPEMDGVDYAKYFTFSRCRCAMRRRDYVAVVIGARKLGKTFRRFARWKPWLTVFPKLGMGCPAQAAGVARLVWTRFAVTLNRMHRAEPLRVLVIEDYPDTADLLAKWVDLAGHAARVCHTGVQALQVASSYQPARHSIGYRFARHVRLGPGTLVSKRSSPFANANHCGYGVQDPRGPAPFGTGGHRRSSRQALAPK